MPTKEIFIIIVLFVVVMAGLSSTVKANTGEAPHTQGWTNALHQMQSGIDRIYQMILELFKQLGDKLIDIKDMFAEQLGRAYQWLRQMVNNIFDWYGGQAQQAQGYFDRFAQWFRDFWGNIFPQAEVPPPQSPSVNGEAP